MSRMSRSVKRLIEKAQAPLVVRHRVQWWPSLETLASTCGLYFTDHDVPVDDGQDVTCLECLAE